MFELNKLYNINCMEGMAQFPDKYFDLAIVDPPYGIGMDDWKKRTKPSRPNSLNYKRKYSGGGWDDKKPTKKYINELIRISNNQIVFGANYFPSLLQDGHGWIFWDKDNGLNNQFSDGEFIYKSFGVLSKYFKCSAFRELNGGKDRIHPTQKPVQLYKWILHNYAKPDMKIIDTHAGSCSSVIAFLDYGCDWIAFEIDKDYYEAASKRIEIHKQQLKLF